MFSRIKGKLKLRVIFFLLACIILSGMLSPIVKNINEDNWKEELNGKIRGINAYLTFRFSQEEKKLNEKLDKFNNELKSLNTAEQKSLLEKFAKYNNSENEYLLFAGNSIEFWTLGAPYKFNANLFTGKSESALYIYNSELRTWIYEFRNHVFTDNDTVKVAVFKCIKKNYSFSNKFYKDINLEQELENKFYTWFKLLENEDATVTKDGRYHTYQITNNIDENIGQISYLKPPLDGALVRIDSNVQLFQYVCLLLIYLVVGLIFYEEARSLKNRTLVTIFTILYVIVFRVLLFVFGIPGGLFESGLTDPESFSSVWGMGIVKTPLEFIITITFFSSIIIYLFGKYPFAAKKNERKFHPVLYVLLYLVLNFLFLLVYRGFAATIRSVVFDSKLRYFKDPSLIPDFPVITMEIGILILGVAVIAVTVLIISYLVKKFPKELSNVGIFALFFVLLQFTGVLFDYLQKEPQGTILVRVSLITVSVLFAFYFHRIKHFGFGDIIYFLLVSSFLSIALLLYYNSELERESIKTTALELTRPNEQFLEVKVSVTLEEFSMDVENFRNWNETTNYNSEAFKVWSSSPLHSESFSSQIIVRDTLMNRLGAFTALSERNLVELPDPETLPSEIFIHKYIIEWSGEEVIRGIVPLKDQGKTVAYLEVDVMYDISSVLELESPEFITVDNSYLNSTVELHKLKIFEFINNELVYAYSDVTLTSGELGMIKNTRFNDFNESWINANLNGEPHIIYALLVTDQGEKRILGVALKKREISWSLFDFFKVFFIHSIFIISISLIFFLLFRYYNRKVLLSFRAKLLTAFLLMSIIPLLILAAYFREFTEERNTDAIFYKLSKRAGNVEQYINRYLGESTLPVVEVYQRATEDLGVSFAIFEDGQLIFSSNGDYYEIGLLSEVINPGAELSLKYSGATEFVATEQVENYKFHSLYYKANLNGKIVIIKVNDIFNNILLPFANIDVDIFIFGSYSLAVIFIVLASLILANQISSPIRRLTSATRSVASGDLSIMLNEDGQGEIRELIDGFNLMVQKLKLNQIKLAEMERETAWKQMARQVAHEIKNPLTPMKLSIQQLIAMYRDNSPRFGDAFNKITTVVIGQIETLTSIASEFSSFARMPKINLEEHNVQKIVDETVNLFSNEKINIKSNFVGTEFNLSTDNDQLQRMLVNMFRNSIQAGSKKINVVAEENSADIIISVIDDGKGIPEEIVNKIFEENFTTKASGMGLGLSMSKKFVESVGGNISVSVGEEKGTKFVITLPKNPDMKKNG